MDLQEFYIILLGIIILIVLYAFIGALFEHAHWHFLHETGAGLMIGCLFGVVVHYTHNSNFDFNQQLFFYALLPPMIFAGGYNLKKRKFMQNIKYIILFGILGTLISFSVILSLTYGINKLQWITNTKNGQIITLSISNIIKYSATICASDSVAALTLIKPKQHPKLFAIIFGEGMVNDAVAIILFHSVGGLNTQNINTGQIFAVIGIFVYTIIASILIGASVGLLCSVGFRCFRFLTDNVVCQVVVLYSLGIMSYLIAEILQMSGVLAVLVCGVVMAHFNFYNLSITGQLSTGYISSTIIRVTFQSISFVAEAIVFIYLGITFINYVTEYPISLSFMGLQMLICIIARNTAIFGLSLLVKIFDKSWNVSWFELAIASVAGTIRGSVAFALILTIEEQSESQQRMIKSTVILLVFISTIVLGAVMPFFINFCLSHDHSQKQRLTILQQSRVTLVQSMMKKEKKKRGWMKILDEEYLKPFFVHNYRARKQQIKQFKKLLKLNSPEYKGGQFVALMKANARQSVIADVMSVPKPSQITFDSNK